MRAKTTLYRSWHPPSVFHSLSAIIGRYGHVAIKAIAHWLK
jgi:hypothetical protein